MLAGVCTLAVLLCVAVYIPAVQRFAVDKATALVAEKTGVRITVERFRLRFPLTVSARGTTVVMPTGDTLVRVEEIGVRAELWPLLRGRVRVVDIGLEGTRAVWRDTVSGITLRARVDALATGAVSFDPAARSVHIARAAAEGGEVAIVMEEGSSAPPADTLPFDWTIEASRLEVRDLGFALDMPPSQDDTPAAVSSAPTPAAPFNYNHIRASEAELSLRDLRYAGGDISARLDGLHLVERSGLRITDGSAEMAMTGGGFSLTGFALETAASDIKGSFAIGVSNPPDNISATPLSMELSGHLSPGEIALFAPLPEAVGRILDGRTVTLDAAADGTLDDMEIGRLTAELSPDIALSGHGRLRSITTPDELSGSVVLTGELRNLDFAKRFITDTALVRRLAIPHGMTFRAGVDFSPERYDIKEFTLRAGAGRLEGRGRFVPRSGGYDADIRLVDFPLDRFLPRDSLGAATLALQAKGRGFDPLTMEATAKLDIDRLVYGVNDLGKITADLATSGGNITGTVNSRSDLLVTDLALDARIARDTLAIPAAAPMSYILSARIDSTAVRMGSELYRIDAATIKVSASMAGTRAALRSGDLVIDLSSPLPPEGLISGATRAGSEIGRQIAARRLSADSLQSAFPDLVLTARAGRGNFLYDIARRSGLDYRTVSAGVSTVAGEPFRLDALAVGFASGDLAIDTLDVHAVRNTAMLDYELRLANRPTTAADLGLIRVAGSVNGNSLIANVLQRNSDGEVGFDFGTGVTLLKNAVRAEIAPDPILGYEQWRVGAAADTFDHPDGSGDWAEYGFDGRLRADLHLTAGSSGTAGAAENTASAGNAGAAGVSVPGATPASHIAITTASLPGIPDGALHLAVRGLDMERMLDLLPVAPDVGGIVSSDLTFGFLSDPTGGNIIAAKGTLGAKDFTYGSRRLADIDADVDFGSDGSGRMALDASIGLDGREALTAVGAYAAGGIDFTVTLPAMPLEVAQRLLPPETVSLAGNLDGTLHITGTPSKPIFEGDVGFTDARVLVGMIGTEFGILPGRITVEADRVALTNFGLVAPNNRRLAINGGINIANLSAPTTDLVISADDFQLVNSRHVGGSQIYGTAALDAAITVRGAFDAMRVRGDVSLSGDTDMVYILRDSGQKVRDERQHIVQFVRFADSLLTEGADLPAPPIRRAGVDMLVGIEIGDGLRATLSLDEMNENRVELIGGGDLAFSMNSQGDTRLAGRYTLSGGTLYYKPPVIPQKVFFVSDGSYVEWTGALASPAINVSATQTMNVTLDEDSGDSRDVAFDVTASVSGSLRGLDMRFDLAAPGDLAIQDQLLAMSDEGRMQQALTLLIYNQYTGPGYSSRGPGLDARSQLNNFVSKEINQWARNNLKGVDFSMGIDTRDDALGGSRTDYSYSVSKTLFSDRVRISIGGRVSDGAEAQNAANQLLEDVSLEYRLTESDNMLLKLFRYNTRESILEGEVTETGGGFVIRRKINRLGDIFRRTRRPGQDNRPEDGK